MTISDLANNPISPDSASFLGLGAAEVFPHDIYSFLMRSLRECDRDAGDLFVLRFVTAMQSEFEDTYARIEALNTLYDPETAPAEALQYVKWLVGFTSRLDFMTGGLSTADLRILISIAVRIWKFKGTDKGLAIMTKAFSTYPARILNYFFFRIIVDEVEIGRAELNVDPWLIDIAGISPSVLPDGVVEVLGPRIRFDLTTLLGATEAVPHDIRIQYVPGKVFQVGISQWNGSANIVYSDDRMGQTVASTSVDDYRVGVDPDEFASDLRIVDDGTGVINRDLIENYVRILRPNSERVNVRYVDFQDTFLDVFLWTVVAGTATHTPADGIVELEDAAETSIVTDMPNDATWSEVHAAVQFKLRDKTAGEWFEVRFYYADALNFYAVRVDPKTRLVSLDRVLAGARTTLDSVTLTAFLVEQFYVMHVDTEDTGAGHQLKYYLDGNLLGLAVDVNFTAGKLGAATAAGQKATVTFADLYQIPLASTRIGP